MTQMHVRRVLYMRRAIQIDVFTFFYSGGEEPCNVGGDEVCYSFRTELLHQSQSLNAAGQRLHERSYDVQGPS